jgi:PAS domain S-box-containing protein
MTGKGGERIGWNELYSFPLADMTTGAVTGVIEFVRDITDRIHVEEALKESEERYRKLVELSPDGICINVGGRYVFANQSMARNVGLDTPNEVIGKNAVDFVHPASRSTVVERIKQALENGLPAAPVEEKYIRADGTTVFMEVAAVPLVYKGQNAAQVVIRDITERKKTEADLKEQTRTLEKANRELEQFAYISSHHMQEPLRKVINFSGLLERRYKGRLDESADRYLDYLIDGAGRMKALIDDLLVYTRLDHSPPDRESVNLNEISAKVVADLREDVESIDDTITIDDLPCVDADAAEMNLLFHNLVSNAVKFHGEQPLNVNISAKNDAGQWIFSVSDNGIGMDPLYSAQVFGVFRKLHPTGKYPGTGIGLALCKKIVERHGGRIWFESEPGEGSVFYFTLGERHVY